MSTRGTIVSEEYQNIVFVRDENGGQYLCHGKDVRSPDYVSENEKQFCLDANHVLGDNW